MKVSRSKLKKGLWQQIQLCPTDFVLDVWVCSDLNNLAEYFKKQYGAILECGTNPTDPQIGGQCGFLHSASGTPCDPATQIYISVDDFDIPIMVHEISHAIDYLSDFTGLEMGMKATEWRAYMTQYLVEKCINPDNYKPYEMT